MKLSTIVRRMHCPLLLCPLLFAAATVAADPPEVQCVLVEKAQIARLPLIKEGKFGRANYGHQIAAGERSVLAIRVFENGSGPPDSQVFKKATLEFKLTADIPTGEEVDVDILRSYYAQGGSAWVTDGGYSWATNPFSHFRMRRDSSGLHVTLEASIDAIRASSISRSRKSMTVEVDIRCPIHRQSVMELSSWIGKVGTNTASFYSIKDLY